MSGILEATRLDYANTNFIELYELHELYSRNNSCNSYNSIKFVLKIS
jgi:hypothetical protein